MAAHAVTPEQTAAVAGWLDGSTPLEGLVVDQDLRWELLIGLVGAGAAGEEEIAAEAPITFRGTFLSCLSYL